MPFPTTLHITKFSPSTLILSIVLLAALLGGIEALARLHIVRDQLLAPSVGSAHVMLESQLHTLEQFEAAHGPVDCIFVGSSQVVHGIHPDTFEAAYSGQTGEALTCFNFGIYGLDAVHAAPIIEMLIKNFEPEVIFFGLSARAIGPTHPNFEPLLDFTDNAWLQYETGQFSPEGWLVDNSRAYRYLLRYQSWLHGLAVVPANTPFEDGFQEKHFLRYGAIDQPPNDLEADLFSWAADWQLVPDQVSALQNIINLMERDETRIFVYEMPVHPSYFAYFHGDMSDHETFEAVVGDVIRRNGQPFWATMPLEIVTFRGWNERHHMMESGAYTFSYWLGSQYGMAVQEGLWGPTPPAEILRNPPLDSVGIPPIEAFYDSRVGLSGEHLEQYVSYRESTDFLPNDARVFNPRTNPDDPGFLRVNAGVYGQDYLPPQGSETTHLYDLLLTFEHMTYETDLDADEQKAISAWRGNKQSAHLIEAGIDYLIYTDAWFAWLSPEEAAILTDPAHYERIGEWYNNTSAETYTLYHAIDP